MSFVRVGEFTEANTALLLGADVSAHATDYKLDLVLGEGHTEILAAVLFHLCEQAERLSPHIAALIDEDGYPFTDRHNVLRSVLAGRDMHLRPFDRRFTISDHPHCETVGADHLLGRPFDRPERRPGFCMQLSNENSDALSGYGGFVASDEEKTMISGYTRNLFAVVLHDVDLTAEAAAFLQDIPPAQ